MLQISLCIFQARYCRPSRNQKIPEINWIADQEIAFPAFGSWNSSRFQNWSSIPERSHWCFAGSLRGLLGGSFRRYKLVRHPRQTSYHYAERYSVGSTNSWRACLSNLIHTLPITIIINICNDGWSIFIPINNIALHFSQL